MKHANEARKVDLAEARIRLAEKMLHRSEEMLDALDKPYLVYNFGGKDNTYRQHTLKVAPVEVRRNAVVTAGITFDKLTRIVERDAGGSEEAVGMLDTLAKGPGRRPRGSGPARPMRIDELERMVSRAQLNRPGSRGGSEIPRG